MGSNLSEIGGWMQQTAEMWLVLELTGSGTMLGIHTALRFGPVLILGAYGGLLTDRFDRLRMLLLTQGLHTLASIMLIMVALMPEVAVVLLFVNAGFRGFINAVDNPLKRRFLRDLASDAELPNAVALNSTIGTVSRTGGPAAAGILIASVGILWCFVINTISFLFVLVALLMVDRKKLRPSPVAMKGRGQIRAGFAYAVAEPRILGPLVVAFVAGVFAWNYAVIVPAYVTDTLGGDASLYGVLLSVVGVGAFIGALAMSRQSMEHERAVYWPLVVTALSLFLAAALPQVGSAALAMLLLGAGGTAVTVVVQTQLQLVAKDEMMGRVMALFSMAFVGSKPIGGAVGGGLIDLVDARFAFAIGALATSGLLLWLGLRTRRPVPATRRELRRFRRVRGRQT